MNKYSFTDAKGATHDVRMTFATIFNVADKVGVDLLNPAVEKDGVLLSDRLLNDPALVARVVAALCGVENETAFYDSITGEVFPKLNDAFWNAYTDFFVQAGRDWYAAWFREALTRIEEKNEKAKEVFTGLTNQTYSVSSPLRESPTGKTEPSGKFQDSPKPDSESTQATAPNSSAQFTTLTANEDKT